MYDRHDVDDHRAELAGAAERRRARGSAPTHSRALTRARVSVGFSVVGLGLRLAAPAMANELRRA